MLLYIMLCIMLTYLMLFAASFNAVCLYNAYFFVYIYICILYIVLYIILAYLMLYTALFHAVCLYNEFCFT